MNWMESYRAPVRRIQVLYDPSVHGNRVVERGLRIFSNRIARRCAATTTLRPADFTLTLSVDPTIGVDGFRISGGETGVSIAGNCPRAVVYGLGKFLRTSGYSAEGFHPSRWQGTSVPTSPFRAIQLDTHWCNSYHTAPEHELREYVEDVILWGINYMEFVFPLIDLHNWDDPEVDRITGQICTLYTTAKALDVKVGMEIVPNQDFVEQNIDIAAELCPGRPGGLVGHNICPNRPGALEYICSYTHGRTFEHLKAHGIALDFICFWPYDEGGCSCEKCAPWGANGYLKACKAVYNAIRNDVPGVEVILSTWCFDVVKGTDGTWMKTNEEWEGLSRALEKDSSWIDYILCDAHGDFPRYPLEHGVPAGLPMINYPEISMYGLTPWGGFGANPLPDHFQRLWHQARDLVQGGMAYSEGIFNDINKAVVSQFYWNRDTTADETVREYINYEYSPAVCDTVRQAIRCIERNHCSVRADRNLDLARQAVDLLRAAEEHMDLWAKKSWRWRILVIRAQLDLLRYTRSAEHPELLEDHSINLGSVRPLKGCEEAKPLLTELCQILHSNLDYNGMTHPHYRLVRPPVMDI